MTSPWLSVLTSSPGNHDQLPVPGDLDGLEGAGEDVVVGDGDRPEPFRLGVLDQRLRLDRAVVRAVRVHVEVDDDPVAVAEGIAVGVRRVRHRAPPAGGVRVDVLEPLRELGRSRSAARRRGPSRPSSRGEPRPRRAAPRTAAASSGCSARPAGSAIAQPLDACLEQQPGAAAGGGHEDGRLGQRRPPRLRLHERPRPRPVAHRRRDRRAARQRRRAREHDLPAGQRRQQAQHRPGDRALPGRQLDDDQLPLPRRREASVSIPSGIVW